MKPFCFIRTAVASSDGGGLSMGESKARIAILGGGVSALSAAFA
jgi:hypothetical protein